ncbi:hypothetical protein JCM19992_09990 [Thermostilla marina]
MPQAGNASSLSDYIREDLRRCIVSENGPPCKLTLPALAAHYGVSVTPVRTAVCDLIEEGLLVKQPNGRLTCRPGKPPADAAEITELAPPRTSADWDRVLVKEVMLASLQQHPVYLREEALAAKYSAGRSVIRQTLNRLAGAQLIEHMPRRGWVVHPLQEDDIRAYLEIRESLELKALDLARPHLIEADLQEMLEGNREVPPGEPQPLDNRLHAYLIEKSQNRYIRNFFRQYTATYYTAVFDYAAPETDVVTMVAGQHRAILRALIAKQWDEARHVLAEHIWSQQPILKNLLASRRG